MQLLWFALTRSSTNCLWTFLLQIMPWKSIRQVSYEVEFYSSWLSFTLTYWCYYIHVCPPIIFFGVIIIDKIVFHWFSGSRSQNILNVALWLLLVVMIRHQLNQTAPNCTYKFAVAIILSLTTIATLVNYKFCWIDPRISIKQSQNAVL